MLRRLLRTHTSKPKFQMHQKDIDRPHLTQEDKGREQDMLRLRKNLKFNAFQHLQKVTNKPNTNIREARDKYNHGKLEGRYNETS